ncbi:MAG: hypothetical protein AAGA48_15020 [Myxococcota bacterium]
MVPAIVMYVELRSGLGSTYFTLELIIPGLAAFLPGYLAYWMREKLWPAMSTDDAG